MYTYPIHISAAMLDASAGPDGVSPRRSNWLRDTCGRERAYRQYPIGRKR